MSTLNHESVDIILSRLKYAKNFNTWKEVAGYLKESAATISIWRKRNSPSAKEKILYRTKGDVRERFLLTGEGPMLENEGQINLPKPIIRGQATSTPPEPPNFSSAPPDRNPPIKVPLVSWVQAGNWEFAADPFHPGDADEWLDTTATRNPSAFALTVHGDSMEPEFVDGDTIVVDPERDPGNGSYIIAKNGMEATFKQYITDGSSVFLKPLNARYPIRDMTGIEFRIVGVVVEKRKRY